MIIKNLKPNIVICWGNRIDSTCGLFYEICKLKKLQVYYSEMTPIPGTFYIDKLNRWEFSKNNINIRNLINDKFEYQNLVLRGSKILDKILKKLPVRHNFDKINYSKDILKTNKIKILILGNDLVGHALIPNKHPYKNITFPIFKDYNEMISNIEKLDGVEIWFKKHPALGFGKYYFNLNSKKIKFFDNINPNILIEKSDIVVSTLSKLEINVLAFKKPLVYAGVGWFWSQGYSFDCSTKEEFIQTLGKLIKNKNIKLNEKDTFAYVAYLEKKYINLFDFVSDNLLINKNNQVIKVYNILNLKIKNVTFNLKSHIKKRDQYFSERLKIKPIRFIDNIKLFFKKFII